MLRQPVSASLADSERILLAGCGGGCDVLGAIPLLVELLDAGREVFLASLSFTHLAQLDGAHAVESLPGLYAVPASAAVSGTYCPEAWLARWLEAELEYTRPVWALEPSGVRPIQQIYSFLVGEQDIDTIILVDGGIDSILRGDETSLGTPPEDLASLAAVHSTDVPTKVLACVGLGAELRDGICHEQVFRRIAELACEDAYLGATAVLPQARSSQRYLQAVDYIFREQQTEKTSHIHTVVTAAARGDYGSQGPHVWLSPLLNMMWYFDLDTVARTHLFLRELEETDTLFDIVARVEAYRKTMTVRQRTTIPI